MSDNVDRYLKVVFWAARRYRRNGELVLRVGNTLSRYSQIERAAWRRYMA